MKTGWRRLGTGQQRRFSAAPRLSGWSTQVSLHISTCATSKIYTTSHQMLTLAHVIYKLPFVYVILYWPIDLSMPVHRNQLYNHCLRRVRLLDQGSIDLSTGTPPLANFNFTERFSFLVYTLFHLAVGQGFGSSTDLKSHKTKKPP